MHRVKGLKKKDHRIAKGIGKLKKNGKKTQTNFQWATKNKTIRNLSVVPIQKIATTKKGLNQNRGKGKNIGSLFSVRNKKMYKNTEFNSGYT